MGVHMPQRCREKVKRSLGLLTMKYAVNYNKRASIGTIVLVKQWLLCSLRAQNDFSSPLLKAEDLEQMRRTMHRSHDTARSNAMWATGTSPRMHFSNARAEGLVGWCLGLKLHWPLLVCQVFVESGKEPWDQRCLILDSHISRWGNWVKRLLQL